jgi:hypothetical protein
MTLLDWRMPAPKGKPSLTPFSLVLAFAPLRPFQEAEL